MTNLTNFSNLDINYRILSTSSKDDEINILPSFGFHKDTSESTTYNQEAGSANGIGESNNKIADTIFTSAGGTGATSYLSNKGRVKRCMQTGFNPVGGSQSVWAGGTTLNSATSGKSHCVFIPPVTTGNTTSIQYNVSAICDCQNYMIFSGKCL